MKVAGAKGIQPLLSESGRVRNWPVTEMVEVGCKMADSCSEAISIPRPAAENLVGIDPMLRSSIWGVCHA